MRVARRPIRDRWIGYCASRGPLAGDKGLKVSHLCYRLLDTVITSGSEVDRAV